LYRQDDGRFEDVAAAVSPTRCPAAWAISTVMVASICVGFIDKTP